jgi:uncharacterized membrane protein
MTVLEGGAVIVRLTQFISLVLTGLLAGLFVGRWLGAPASQQYDGPVFTEVQQRIDATVGNTAPVLIMATIAALVVLLVVLRDLRSPRFLLAGGALVCVIALTVSTQLVNVPLNEEINTWSPQAPPPDWSQVRERWETFHTLRTVFAVLALGLLAASLTLTAPRARQLNPESQQS